jgi:CBS domain-containing protein
MQLREIMTHDVHAIPPGASLKRAAQEMKSCDIGALPVCQNDKLIGFITDRDIAMRAPANATNS